MVALCFLLLCICYCDYKYHKIPNVLLLLMLITGLIRGFIKQGVIGFLLFTLTFLLVMTLFYLFFQIGALGAGDVKLFGICSAYLPVDKVLSFLFFSLLIAAIISLIKLVTLKLFTGLQSKECLKAGIPLAGPVFAGILLYIGGFY